MLEMLIAVSAPLGYVFVTCATCVFLMRVDPWHEFAYDRTFCWIMSAIWPVSIVVLMAVWLVTAVFHPLAIHIIGRPTVWIAKKMDAVVTWATTPREKRVKLPKMKVMK